MRKAYLVDGIIGFIAAFLLFLIVPFIVFRGEWGLVGYDTFHSLSALCVVYISFDCILFLIYRELPFYKKRHESTVESFLFALGAFLVGAVLGYGAAVFAGLFLFSAASGPSL
jgi:hypothetical protein